MEEQKAVPSEPGENHCYPAASFWNSWKAAAWAQKGLWTGEEGISAGIKYLGSESSGLTGLSKHPGPSPPTFADEETTEIKVTASGPQGLRPPAPRRAGGLCEPPHLVAGPPHPFSSI